MTQAYKQPAFEKELTHFFTFNFLIKVYEAVTLNDIFQTCEPLTEPLNDLKSPLVH